MTVTILEGDALAMLRTLPDRSMQCCVTSPPYFRLRDYGVEGQIGLEETPGAYVARLVEVFREVRRVLRDDGTLWLNLGDSYASNAGGYDQTGSRGSTSHHTIGKGTMAAVVQDRRRLPPTGLKPKDLIGIPWRVAFALQADGWYLRQDIIWHKPNPMPESVEDRCTKAHEYVFLLTKSSSYFYDAEAIREGADRGNAGSEFHTGKTGDHQQGRASSKPRAAGNKTHKYVTAYNGADSEEHRTKAGLLALAEKVFGSRNMRSVWSITSQPYGEAHFATMPPRLAERCVLAATSAQGQCSSCGAPYGRIVERSRSLESGSGRSGRAPTGKGHHQAREGHDLRMGAVIRSETKGWKPSCNCAPPGTITRQSVLDPFGGAGTTALVADRLGRDATIIELNPDYAALARRRIAEDQGPLFSAPAEAAE